MQNARPALTGVPRPRGGLPWYVRIPLKWMIFAGVTLFTLFPNPVQLRRHLTHLADPQKMIQPDAPELADFEAKFISRLEALDASQPGEAASKGPWRKRLSPRDVQGHVERFVYDHVDYAWDWDQWGSADYMPTVEEMFARAASSGGRLREDCDGRAVMAASLMRRLGYDSTLVTDLRHVWVRTSQGDWMGPGRAAAVRSTATGQEVDLLAAAINAPVALSYGVAVFPLWRELIILAAAWLLLGRPGVSWTARGIGLVLLVQGLLFMRTGYLSPRTVSAAVKAWPAWVGLVHIAAGLAWLMLASLRVARNQKARAATVQGWHAPGAPGPGV